MEDWKKKFVFIWTGQLFSILSSAAVQFAVVIWISMETRSASVLAFATISALLPQSLLGPFVGVFVDRWNRKHTMILADSFVALCSAVLAVLFYLDVIELWHIYIMLALRSLGNAFHAPAMSASVPLLAPASELMRVSGVNQMISSVCNIAGPALGGLFIANFDMTYVLLFDVMGAAIACISLLFVAIPNPKPSSDSKAELSWKKEMKEGFNAVYSRKGIALLMLLSVSVTFFIMPVGTLFPLMTLEHFMGNAYQMSLVEVVWGGGMLLGGAVLGIWRIKAKKVTMINASYLVLGFSFLLSGLLPVDGFIFFVLLTALGGFACSFYHVPFTTLLQTHIEPQMLGRVFSLFSSASLLPSMIGLLATGYIADNIGLTNAFIISGALIMLVGLISYFIPLIMTIKDRE
jgi:Permeases of the major facilitator superfamily